MTKEELGRGFYAVITVGIFRGLGEAVKSLHSIIISHYNRFLFSREMSIASRVHHPNLVQFIGATKVEKDREHQVVLQELQEKDRELEAVRRYQQQAFTDDHWVIIFIVESERVI